MVFGFLRIIITSVILLVIFHIQGSAEKVDLKLRDDVKVIYPEFLDYPARNKRESG